MKVLRIALQKSTGQSGTSRFQLASDISAQQ